MEVNALDEINIRNETKKILQSCGNGRGSLIPVLQRVQGELGYIPVDAMLEIANCLEIPEVDVFSVVTFYNQFRLSPPGRHQIQVCMGTACHMKGGNTILDCWERRLNIKVGETTPDRQFSLERVACVGCCTMAPVVVVDETVHGKVSPTRVDGILLSFELEKQQEEGGVVE